MKLKLEENLPSDAVGLLKDSGHDTEPVHSQGVGRTRLYTFNPRYPFLRELLALLEKALAFYPREEQERLLMNRRRPRRKGKPDEANR
ncbi:MAG: hypothetical protein HYU84_01485 [Chloroflexi bacterium]|nr:hypothetical protein [Chloroflexota bacterium]MBI3159673.1 hypothetical protein [Chloroflexota bacterium]